MRKSEAPSTLRQRILKMEIMSTVTLAVHTNPFTKTKEFENAGFLFSCANDKHVISLTEFSANTILKWPVFLNSSGVVWTKNIWLLLLLLLLLLDYYN